MKFKLILILSIELALTLTACSEGQEKSSKRLESAHNQSDKKLQVSTTNTITLMRLPNSEAGDAAASGGILQNKNSCIGVQAGEVFYLLAVTNPAIFWSGDGLHLPDGSIVPLGSYVMLGGSAAGHANQLHFTNSLPAECSNMTVWTTVMVTKA